MGTKKLINTGSSPPISYTRHCDSFQQHNGNNSNNTCCSVVTSTNAMFTKLRNYFTHIRETTSSTHRRNHNHRHHEKLTNCNSITATIHNNISSNTISSNITRPSNMFNIISITMLVLLALINTATSNPVFVDNPSLAQCKLYIFYFFSLIRIYVSITRTQFEQLPLERSCERKKCCSHVRIKTNKPKIRKNMFGNLFCLFC